MPKERGVCLQQLMISQLYLWRLLMRMKQGINVTEMATCSHHVISPLNNLSFTNQLSIQPCTLLYSSEHSSPCILRYPTYVHSQYSHNCSIPEAHIKAHLHMDMPHISSQHAHIHMHTLSHRTYFTSTCTYITTYP